MLKNDPCEKMIIASQKAGLPFNIFPVSIGDDGNFSKVVYYKNNQTVYVGSGLIWDDVYQALEPFKTKATKKVRRRDRTEFDNNMKHVKSKCKHLIK